MSAILLTTTLSGVLTSKLLLELHIHNPIVRYPLAVLLAYLVFFLCIKLWLWYVSPKKGRGDSNISDWIDVPTPSFCGSSGGGLPPFRAGGGDFSGAGASASFDAHYVAGAHEPVSSIIDTGSTVVDSVGDAVGEAAGAIGEEGGFIVAIVLGVLAALIVAVLGSAIYLMLQAPVILSEAAFEGLLAASLIKRARLIDDEDWMGSVFKTTWKPFTFALVVAFIVAIVLHSYFPEARTLSEILPVFFNFISEPIENNCIYNCTSYK